MPMPDTYPGWPKTDGIPAAIDSRDVKAYQQKYKLSLEEAAR